MQPASTTCSQQPPPAASSHHLQPAAASISTQQKKRPPKVPSTCSQQQTPTPAPTASSHQMCPTKGLNKRATKVPNKIRQNTFRRNFLGQKLKRLQKQGVLHFVENGFAFCRNWVCILSNTSSNTSSKMGLHFVENGFAFCRKWVCILAKTGLLFVENRWAEFRLFFQIWWKTNMEYRAGQAREGTQRASEVAKVGFFLGAGLLLHPCMAS